MSTETSKNEVNPTEANQTNKVSNQIQTVTKRVERATTEGSTKAKNPRRVEQGKKLTEHNKKMKQQLVKMKLAGEAGEESNQNKIYQTAFENRNLIIGGLGITGILLYLIWKNKSTAQPTRQIIQPKREVSKAIIPNQEPILDME